MVLSAGQVSLLLVTFLMSSSVEGDRRFFFHFCFYRAVYSRQNIRYLTQSKQSKVVVFVSKLEVLNHSPSVILLPYFGEIIIQFYDWTLLTSPLIEFISNTHVPRQKLTHQNQDRYTQDMYDITGINKIFLFNPSQIFKLFKE